VNYFLEWTVLVAIGCGLAVGDFIARGPVAAKGWARGRMAAPWLVAIQTLAGWALIEADFGKRAAQWADYDRIAQAMRAAPGPIISDDMVLLLRAGKTVVMEPAIFAELSAHRVLDDRPMLARLRDHRFSMVVTEGWPGDPVVDSRYSPAMARVMTSAYPQQFRLADYYIVRLPAGPVPAWAHGLAQASQGEE
ncbi:MAG TPA: hypothetical protein VI199_01460, partial [Novosphingobium sp.]